MRLTAITCAGWNAEALPIHQAWKSASIGIAVQNAPGNSCYGTPMPVRARSAQMMSNWLSVLSLLKRFVELVFATGQLPGACAAT